MFPLTHDFIFELMVLKEGLENIENIGKRNKPNKLNEKVEKYSFSKFHEIP